jgi:hypothetical protein
VTGPFPTHADERGVLLPVDLGDLPFVARRVFVVTGPPDGARRGGHTVPCRELVVLVAGSATVRRDGEVVRLAEAGDAVLLEPGCEMDYDLAPGGSTVLVIADAAYVP